MGVHNESKTKTLTFKHGLCFTRSGRNINGVKPYHCLEENSLADGSICLEWDQNARLYFNYEEKNGIECHDIKWEALNQNVFPQDCYELPGT